MNQKATFLSRLKQISTLDLRTATRQLIGRLTAGKVVTVDIDDTAIRILEARSGVVKKWASIPLVSPKTEGQENADPPAIGAMVKELMASSDMKARKVVASLSGLYSVSRLLPMAPAPGLTTQEAVRDLANEALPLSSDQLYLSWQTLDTADGTPQVLIIGVPRDMVDNQLGSLKKAGISPQMLELKAMTLCRAVNRKQALILNIGPYSFDVVVLANYIPEIMHTIAWQQDGSTGEDKAEHLALKLELAVDFYNLRHPEAPIDSTAPVFITGQMTGDAALMEKLRARLGFPVETLAPPLKYPSHLPVAQYAVNLGLVLKSASNKNHTSGESLPFNINFLPQAYRPWRPSARQLYSFASIIIALALLFPVYQATSEEMDKTARLQTTYNSRNNELQKRLAELKAREPLQKAIDDYNLIIGMGGNMTGDLQAIKDAAGKLGVTLESIVHEGKKVSVTVDAGNYQAFRQFLTALKESGRFDKVTPPEEGYPYTIQGEIKLDVKTKK